MVELNRENIFSSFTHIYGSVVCPTLVHQANIVVIQSKQYNVNKRQIISFLPFSTKLVKPA